MNRTTNHYAALSLVLSTLEITKIEYQGAEFRVFVSKQFGNVITEKREDLDIENLCAYKEKFDVAEVLLSGDPCIDKINDHSEKVAFVALWNYIDDGITNARVREYDKGHYLLEFDLEFRSCSKAFPKEDWGEYMGEERVKAFDFVSCIFEGYKIEELKGTLNYNVETPQGSIRNVTPDTCDCQEFKSFGFKNCQHIELSKTHKKFRFQLAQLRGY